MAQHISIRVPWKDNGYDGFVCKDPCRNTACLRLKNIAKNKNDERETTLAGHAMQGHEEELPCISEGGAFMSHNRHIRTTIHPYKNERNTKTHGHFRETELIYPGFSLPGRPFRWTMLKVDNKNNLDNLVKVYNIDYDHSREPELGDWNNWVQDAENQRAIFDSFYRAVMPRKSLVIPYAKQVPFIEDTKRIVMGVGFVDSVIKPPEHNCTGSGGLRSILWETMIGHSIRNDCNDGFLLPYREMMEYADNNPDFDIRSITVFAEDDYFYEFSYATEHVSHDATISVLLQSIKALEIIRKCIPGNWDECIKWVKARLDEVWKDRGSFPGAGTMLYCMGFAAGLIIADEVKNDLPETESFLQALENAIKDPDRYLSKKTSATIGRTEQNAFLRLNQERKTLFWLLSRFSLSPEQAMGIFNRGYTYINNKGEQKERKSYLKCSDAEMIKNPYLIYEQTRLLSYEFQVPIRNVDMAVFPPVVIAQNNPLPEPSFIPSENDERRVRAISVKLVENELDNGHTVFPQSGLVTRINELPLDPYCTVTGDIMGSLTDFFRDELEPVEMKDGGMAYQLVRIKEFDDIIRSAVDKRVNSTDRHIVNENWKAIVDEAFKQSELTDAEKRAREEKATILKELAEARLSVLIGGAGTGKTTLLALLCKSKQVQEGKILLLAPTGKARVRIDTMFINLKFIQGI